MKLLGLFAMLIVAASADLLYEWNRFKEMYNKVYASKKEERRRMKIFFKEKKTVDAHNKMFEQGLVSFTVGINEFSDLRTNEFKALMNGHGKTEVPFEGLTGFRAYQPSNEMVPKEMDWRTKGAVTPVKFQGSCRSSWAFSAVGSLEGQHFLKTGKLVSLSEQNLVDCSGRQGNKGCRGGAVPRAFNYVKENGGIDTQESYPYTGFDERCRFNNETVGATCTGFVQIPARREWALKKAVALIGPISVAFDGEHSSLKRYKDGVYYEPKCRRNQLNSAGLIVGYGTEDGRDYWLVKNSWSVCWGDEGYFKIARNKNNHCGLASKAFYPTM